MGANWLGMALAMDENGLSDKVTASALLQCPSKIKESIDNLNAVWGGFINYMLAKRLLKVLY